MGHGLYANCGCFPTGQPYPGIADLMQRARAAIVGVAAEFDPTRGLRELPIAVVDTETTGRDPIRGDRVVEIAVVHFDGGVVTARHALIVDPCMPIPKEASNVHGIKDEDVRGKPKWDAIASDVLAMLKGRLPVAYNANFDRSFVFAEMRKAGIVASDDPKLPPAMRTNVDWIDPLVWARVRQSNTRGFKLGEVAARLGIDLTNAHRATDDAEAAGRVLFTLLGDDKLTYGEIVQQQRQHAAAWEAQRATWRR